MRFHRSLVYFPLSEDFAASMYNQVHQERIVATVQPHDIVQDIPQLPIVEWIQEQIVETIEVVPQERIEVQMNTSSTSTSNATPVIESVTPAPVFTFNPVIEYVSTLMAGDAAVCAVSSPAAAVQQIVAEETTQDLVAYACLCRWHRLRHPVRTPMRGPSRWRPPLRGTAPCLASWWKPWRFQVRHVDTYPLFPAHWQARVYSHISATARKRLSWFTQTIMRKIVSIVSKSSH